MINNPQIEKINSIINFVEDNIKKDITLEIISQCVHLSKFHTDRIFKAMTNRSLMDYVRCRKLSHSLNSLLHTNMKIVEISLEYSFKYEQSYIRSFKRTFQISPGKFRKEKPEIEIVDKLSLNYITSKGKNMNYIGK
jgi:AraC family transcriptional regulator